MQFARKGHPSKFPSQFDFETCKTLSRTSVVSSFQEAQCHGVFFKLKFLQLPILKLSTRLKFLLAFNFTIHSIRSFRFCHPLQNGASTHLILSAPIGFSEHFEHRGSEHCASLRRVSALQAIIHPGMWSKQCNLYCWRHNGKSIPQRSSACVWIPHHTSLLSDLQNPVAGDVILSITFEAVNVLLQNLLCCKEQSQRTQIAIDSSECSVNHELRSRANRH